MPGRTISRFGGTYPAGILEQTVETALEHLISIEIERIVSFRKSEGLWVREDLLVMFVEMYARRFALPAFILTHGRSPELDDLPWVLSRLYMCLIGRALDDLIDGDSEMFTARDSHVIYTRYLGNLTRIQAPDFVAMFVRQLSDSCAISHSVLDGLEYSRLKDDVLARVCYFVKDYGDCHSESRYDLFHKYVAILLLFLDLKDALADGPGGKSSTLLSRTVWQKLQNDEGKLLLDQNLLAAWDTLYSLISNEAKKLRQELKSAGLSYPIHILDEAGETSRIFWHCETMISGSE